MQIPLQIRYHRCKASNALEALIQEKVAELEKFYSRITGCRVLIERPGEHHRTGKGAHFRVRIELTVPGKVLVVSRDPMLHMAHEDAFLATNEAFHEVRRQLEDYARKQRGAVKVSEHSSHARVIRLIPSEGYGFLETADGREVYFHRASVLDGGFDRLAVGTEVRFAEELGEKGPQASSVQLVGHSGHHEIPKLD
jgi:cold shock CspA family protein/ribosome-associated translation inhibitor RaiA